MRKAAAAGAAAVAIIGLAAWLLAEPAAPTAATPPKFEPPQREAPRGEVPKVRTGAAQLTGRVRDASRAPVAGAKVEVIFADRPSLPPACARLVEGCSCGDDLEEALAELELAFKPLAEVETAADGTFSVTGLPAAKLEVRAHSKTKYGGTTVVLGDRAAQVDLIVDRTPTPFLFVVGDDGPVVNAAIVAAVGGRFVDFARTGEGRAHALLAPASAVRIFARGMAPGLVDVNEDDPPDDLAAEEPAVVQVRLRPGVMVSGTLSAASGPPAGVLVNAASEGRWGEAGCATALTRADGTWTLGPVGQGRLKVTAKQGAMVAQQSVATFRAGDAGVALSLLPDVTVRGHVVDGQRRPMAGVEVDVGWSPLEGGGVDPARVVSTADGAFEHRGPPGQYSVSASAKGFLTAEARSEVREGEWAVELQVTQAARVTGRLVRADGKPVVRPHLSVRPRDRAVRFSAFSPPPVFDDQGRFTVETWPGEVELDGFAEGTLHAVVVVRAPASDVILTLPRGGRVEGKVVDETGAPVKAARVTAISGENSYAYGTSGGDGAFAIDTVPDGPCVVRAQSDRRTERKPGPTPILADRAGAAKTEVKDGRSPQVLVRIEPVKAARGVVVDEANRPLAGVALAASERSPPVIRGDLPYEVRRMIAQGTLFFGMGFQPTVTSAADGTFVFEGLSDRNHILQGRLEGLEEDPENPVIIRAGSERVTLVLRPTHFLIAAVTGADGEVLPKVTVGGEALVPTDGVVKAAIRFAYSGPINISAPGHAQTSRTVTITPQKDSVLEPVRLVRGRMVTVKITDLRSGQPIDGWILVGGQALPRTPRPGEFAVPIGAFAARVGAADHLEAAIQVAADQAQVEVALDPGGTVTGPATDADGRPLTGYAYFPQADVNGKMVFGQIRDGTFILRGVPKGTWKVSITRNPDQKRGPEKAVDVPAEGTVSVPLVGP